MKTTKAVIEWLKVNYCDYTKFPVAENRCIDERPPQGRMITKPAYYRLVKKAQSELPEQDALVVEFSFNKWSEPSASGKTRHWWFWCRL